jgi:hypothetical protein
MKYCIVNEHEEFMGYLSDNKASLEKQLEYCPQGWHIAECTTS